MWASGNSMSLLLHFCCELRSNVPSTFSPYQLHLSLKGSLQLCLIWSTRREGQGQGPARDQGLQQGSAGRALKIGVKQRCPVARREARQPVWRYHCTRAHVGSFGSQHSGRAWYVSLFRFLLNPNPTCFCVGWHDTLASAEKHLKASHTWKSSE